jgi:ASC-1-like (ASCH) protein
MSHTYEKHLSEPWFSLIKIGKKIVEGRLHIDWAKEVKQGDTIVWSNSDFKFERTFRTVVKEKRIYESFHTFLTEEGLENALPGIDTIDEGVKIYRKYYTEEMEKNIGVVAISIERI